MTPPAAPRVLPLLLFFVFATPLAAQQSAPATDPKAIARGLAEAGIVATVRWDAAGEGAPPIAVVAAAEGDGGRLRFFSGEPLKLLASHGEGGWTPASAAPACPSRCPLVTLWRAGFKLKLVVFAAGGGEPRPVLEAETLAPPETLADPERGEPIFILKTPPAPGSAPAAKSVEAQLWRWRDGRYQIFATVPWAKRLASVPGIGQNEPPARPAPRKSGTRRP